MKSKKIFAGDRLKRLRTQTGIRQGALANTLAISPSYLNQIESNQRPITPPLLVRLAAALRVPEDYFADSADVRRAGQVREALGDPAFLGGQVTPEEVHDITRTAPAFSEAFLTLYRAFTALQEQRQPGPSRFPYDEVRDWVQAHRNHFDPLDRAAEELFESKKFSSANLVDDLVGHLRDRHAITVVGDAALLEQGTFWRLDNPARQLALAEGATSESKLFWMAHVICQLEQKALVEREVRRAHLSTDEAQGLARIALANYFAGALLMPYRRFHEHARLVRHDIQNLQSQFGTSFEQVCHRLSTMQRPDLPGIPFYFAKIDIAGNILKRSSVTPFEFAQFGGPCPLWNVFRAFAHPREILIQLARTPEQITYLNIARTVGRGSNSFLIRPRAVAVVLGCEIRYATETVYTAGLNLNNAADPIGPGCRACERTVCRHRSVPPMGQALDTGTAERGVVPYRMRAE